MKPSQAAKHFEAVDRYDQFIARYVSEILDIKGEPHTPGDILIHTVWMILEEFGEITLNRVTRIASCDEIDLSPNAAVEVLRAFPSAFAFRAGCVVINEDPRQKGLAE